MTCSSPTFDRHVVRLLRRDGPNLELEGGRGPSHPERFHRTRMPFMDAARRLPMIKFWKVSETTESGKAFLNQMPLDDVPFFIILDQNSHPESIGADSTLLRLLVSESPSANQ